MKRLNVRKLYDRFDAPVTRFDCGQKCAPDNPSGKPFCCDICHAVPAVYRQEWDYLDPVTDLWHEWRGDECTQAPEDPGRLQEQTPDSMLLLACKGPQACQRDYRALSCRQFPFFPYITRSGRFLGLACEWEFEKYCWVTRNLHEVTRQYRTEFVGVYDQLLAEWPDELESYALHSEELRAFFGGLKRRFRILHRNGWDYLVSPHSERIARLPDFTAKASSSAQPVGR